MNYSAHKAEELRNRYLAESVETATPAGRLVMLFDALEMDLARADRAFADGKDLKEISDRLIHAQEILLVLRDTIDPSGWEGAPRLIGLYNFYCQELLTANLQKDRERAAGVAELLKPLAAAWRQAADIQNGEVVSAAS